MSKSTNKKRRSRDLELSWSSRKRFLKYIVGFCSFCILYVMFKGDSGAIYKEVLGDSFGLLGAAFTVYITGKTAHETILSGADIKYNAAPAPHEPEVDADADTEDDTDGK